MVTSERIERGMLLPPPLFNIYHQAPMRTAALKRKADAAQHNEAAGISISFVAGSDFPGSSRWEKKNSENQIRLVDKSLFADDTTPTGKKKELDRGIEIIKKEMTRVEEANNEDKEETLVFGTEEGGQIRMLGSYIDAKCDLKQRMKRAGNAWRKVKVQLKNSKMSKRLQARIVEAVVESTILFDANVRTWYISDIKKLQSQVDRMYRHIWSRKDMEPLRAMQEQHLNMQDIRNILGVKSIRVKIEKRVLERIGHVFRLNDNSLVKNVTLGWLTDLEEHPKKQGKKRKTVLYWKKLLKEAGIDYTKINSLTKDRKGWKMAVRERANHIHEWERKGAHSFDGEERGNRNVDCEVLSIFECEYCDKICRTKAGLVIHTKKIHEIATNKKSFNCDKCNMSFNAEANLKNHKKNCSGVAAASPDMKKCACGKEVSTSNFARHQRSCGAAPQGQSSRGSGQERPRGNCDRCGANLLLANMARHQEKSCPGRMAVP